MQHVIWKVTLLFGKLSNICSEVKSTILILSSGLVDRRDKVKENENTRVKHKYLKVAHLYTSG